MVSIESDPFGLTMCQPRASTVGGMYFFTVSHEAMALLEDANNLLGFISFSPTYAGF